MAESSWVFADINKLTTMRAHLVGIIGEEAMLKVRDQIPPSALGVRRLEIALLQRVPHLVQGDLDLAGFAVVDARVLCSVCTLEVAPLPRQLSGRAANSAAGLKAPSSSTAS